MYGVLSADIVFVGVAVCTFIMSVIFYRINEVSPRSEVKEDRVRDLILDGVDHENSEMMAAINALKQEQTRLLTSYKKAVYENKEISSTVNIKKDIIRKFISSLSINYEMVSKQELKELLFKLFNEFVKKNSNYLFEPNFFPSEIHEYSNWVSTYNFFIYF